MDVWVAPLDVGPERLADLVAALSPAEQVRAGRYRFPRDAGRFSAARGWLRHVLGAELGIAPADVLLSEGQGKPRLAGLRGPNAEAGLRGPNAEAGLRGPNAEAGLAGLCFNVSHARDLALIAVAGCEVGVDVEHTADGPAGLDAVRLACSPAEADLLDRMPPGERDDAFLRRWTAKEAYLKARGLGLVVPPDRVELEAAGPEGAVPVRVAGEPGPAGWWVRELRPAAGYVGAVAAERPVRGVRLRALQP